jgi:hypothetical protein
MVSIRPSVVTLRAGDEMKLEFYLESSGMKISSLSSNALRGMSLGSSSREGEEHEYRPGQDEIPVGSDETKGF